MNARGRLYVISAPSGAGKTSLVQALLAAIPTLSVSISHTTRPPRAHEVNGRDYHFVTVPQFRELLAANAFLEHAQVFDNFYGTGREQIERRLAAGENLLLEIDWQGARQVREAQPDSVSIFILPPSRAALKERLHARRTDSDEVINRRLRDAASDISHCPEFDFVVINDRFEQAISQLQQIIDGRGERLRADRPELKPLLASLLA